MWLLRAFGLLFVAAGFVAFVMDGVKTIASANLVITPLGKAWFDVHVASLNLVQAVIERYTFPFLWDPVLVSVLQMPGWVVFTVLGIALYYLGRRRAASGVITN